MSSVILIVLFALFIVAPVIAALIALVHAVIDSVTKKRIPNVISIVLLLLGLAFLAVLLYGDRVYNGSSGSISLYLFGTVWINARIILKILTYSLSIAGLTLYIFLSFREDSVRRFGRKKSARKKKGTETDAAQEAAPVEVKEKTRETKEEERESNRRLARLYRILTISVAVILTVVLLAFLFFEWYVVNAMMSHDMISFTSPDGERTIIVDNLQQGTYYGADLYLRLDAFKIRKLEEKEGRRKYMDIEYDDITWEDQGVRIPYGNLELFYYYEPVEVTD